MSVDQLDEESPVWRVVDRVLAVATAAIFAWGVLLGGWSVFAVMALFWFENVVIGIFNLARMITTGVRTGPGGLVGALFTGAFFTVHYGLFTAVHGVLLVAIFGGGVAGTAAGTVGATDDGMAGPLFGMIERVVADREGWLAVLTITLMQAVAFVHWSRATRSNPPPLNELMAAPYGRIVILHLTLIFGAFLATVLKAPVFGALLLIGLKLAYDLVSVNRGSKAESKSAVPARERVQRLPVRTEETR